MKRILILIFLCISQISFSQLKLKTEKRNNLYIVPCKVNNVPMDFIFDTGATQVTISETVALKLIKNGSIKKEDIISNSNYKTASGEIKSGTEIILNSIKIGNLELKNISATIIHNPNAPLLLGQNVLSRLGKITLEENELTIHNIKTVNSDCNLENLIPFQIGMSRFDISILESQDKDFSLNSKHSGLNANDLDVLNSTRQENRSKFISYLNKTVKTTLVNLYKSYSNCLNSKEVHFQLYLVNDYLYKINITLENDDFANNLEDYNTFMALVPEEYLYTSSSTISDRDTQSKIGEGVTFYKYPKEKLNTVKIEEINISHNIKYDKYYDNIEKTYKTNNKIKYFKTSIQLVNLKNTELTNQGY